MEVEDIRDWDDLSILEAVEEASGQVQAWLSTLREEGVDTKEMESASQRSVFAVAFFSALKRYISTFELYGNGELSEVGLLTIIKGEGEEMRLRRESYNLPAGERDPLYGWAVAAEETVARWIHERDFAAVRRQGEELMEHSAQILSSVLLENARVRLKFMESLKSRPSTDA